MDLDDPIHTSHAFIADFEGGFGSSVMWSASIHLRMCGAWCLDAPLGMPRLSVESCLSVRLASADSGVWASLALAQSGEMGS